MATLRGLSADRFVKAIRSYGIEAERIAGDSDVLVFRCARGEFKQGAAEGFAAGLTGRRQDGTYDTAFLRTRVPPRDSERLNIFNKSALFVRASQAPNRDVFLNMDFLALGLSDQSVSAHLELWFMSVNDYLTTM